MSYKSVTVKRYKNRKLYYDGLYLNHDKLMKLFRKGYTVKVIQHGVESEVTEQIALGYKVLLSSLAANMDDYSTMKIFEIGDSIQKVFTGRKYHEKAELTNYSNILDLLGLRTKTTS